MRITPLLSGDQPSVIWHSIDMFSCSSTTNTPRGHEDGELMNKSDWLTSCPRRVLITILNMPDFKIKTSDMPMSVFRNNEMIDGTDND